LSKKGKERISKLLSGKTKEERWEDVGKEEKKRLGGKKKIRHPKVGRKKERQFISLLISDIDYLLEVRGGLGVLECDAAKAGEENAGGERIN